ncbi:GNAT family N-acetyltransferase [Marinomonas atlantica]|uniref:GNAT family N-acetyltransferase n=1 Tax=Marinomonas atlantica TaxID=1806668 RepID=UPI0008308C8B|nr:GNAT family N-acetyltransferase [Marinomonas atlantica]
MNAQKVVIDHFDEELVSFRALLDVYHRSVHAIPDMIYSPEQKSVWAPDCLEVSSWHERLQEHQVWVALGELNKECLGFIELDLKGDIECLYVCPQAQRQGIAKALLIKAREHVVHHYENKTEWRVQASDAAYELFLKFGFLPTQRNQIERLGVLLENTSMAKSLR